MARNGSGVYSLPAGYEAVTGETILATQHNTPLEDLQADANLVRPIVAGGTGESTVIAAADALSTKGTAIASAATTDIGAATGRFVHITGTTTITAFGTKTAGVERVLTFDGALTLTHNATSLILPGAANITTAAGDIAVMVSEGSGNWRCASYQRATGVSIGASEKYTTVTGSKTLLATERGQFFRKTGTSATWAPQAAATCGDGWHITIRVEDNYLTIDPSGAETIDGSATLIVPANTTIEIWCNGTAFYTNQSGVWVSWTPGISFGEATTGITYTGQIGSYIREGKTVIAVGNITLSSKGSATSTARITGFPFAAAGNQIFNLMVANYAGMASITGGGITGLMGTSSTTAVLYQPGSAASAVLTDANFTNTANLRFQVIYEVA